MDEVSEVLSNGPVDEVRGAGHTVAGLDVHDALWIEGGEVGLGPLDIGRRVVAIDI